MAMTSTGLSSKNGRLNYSTRSTMLRLATQPLQRAHQVRRACLRRRPVTPPLPRCLLRDCFIGFAAPFEQKVGIQSVYDSMYCSTAMG